MSDESCVFANGERTSTSHRPPPAAPAAGRGAGAAAAAGPFWCRPPRPLTGAAFVRLPFPPPTPAPAAIAARRLTPPARTSPAPLSAATVQEFLERYEVGETIGVGGAAPPPRSRPPAARPRRARRRRGRPGAGSALLALPRSRCGAAGGRGRAARGARRGAAHLAPTRGG